MSKAANGRPSISVLAVIFLTGFALGLSGKSMWETYKEVGFYTKLEGLKSKSEAHRMMMDNIIKCLRDDRLPEASCITNTILLAEVNGYQKDTAQVLRDAGLPR